MKTKLTLILVLMLSAASIAQQGINYKALIKDDSGNVVANQSISLLFNIYEGAALSNLVYRESHMPITDANGIIIVNIGEGTIANGSFTTIDWGSDAYYLNTQIDTGSGLVDMGTTEFKTVPYSLHAANVTGLEILDEGNGIGWRLKGRDPENYADIGFGAVDLSGSSSAFPSSTKGASGANSTAMGFFTTASGVRSTVMGDNSIASGSKSTAMGNSTTASGNNATAMGNSTTASGDRSTSMGSFTNASGPNSIAIGTSTTASGLISTATGFNTIAIGDLSTAMGNSTNAISYVSTAIGQYNIVFGSNQTGWLESDPVFEIGNGTSPTNRSNAFTVLKNGRIGIGTVNPYTSLQIELGSDANLTNGHSGYLVIGSLSGANLVFDNNEIMARNVLETSTLYLQANGGAVSVGGAVVHSSDRRLKRDIQPISYGLQTVLDLQPKSYFWKNRPNQKERSLGLIAQDVQPIINELVLSNEKDEMLSVNYTELIPILIKAIQEQQKTIDRLDSKVNNQQAIISNQYNNNKLQNSSYISLLERVEQLETVLNTPKQ